jgi:hypothetical protein
MDCSRWGNPMPYCPPDSTYSTYHAAHKLYPMQKYPLMPHTPLQDWSPQIRPRYHPPQAWYPPQAWSSPTWYPLPSQPQACYRPPHIPQPCYPMFPRQLPPPQWAMMRPKFVNPYPPKKNKKASTVKVQKATQVTVRTQVTQTKEIATEMSNVTQQAKPMVETKAKVKKPKPPKTPMAVESQKKRTVWTHNMYLRLMFLLLLHLKKQSKSKIEERNNILFPNEGITMEDINHIYHFSLEHERVDYVLLSQLFYLLGEKLVSKNNHIDLLIAFVKEKTTTKCWPFLYDHNWLTDFFHWMEDYVTIGGQPFATVCNRRLAKWATIFQEWEIDNTSDPDLYQNIQLALQLRSHRYKGIKK